MCLAKFDKEEYLSLAAEIANASGQTTYANYIAEKKEKIKTEIVSTESDLTQLPTKMELLMKNKMADDIQNGEGHSSQNGEGHLSQNGEGHSSQNGRVNASLNGDKDAPQNGDI